MALIIPSYPNTFDPANPIINSYAWIAGLSLDLSRGNGRVVLSINPNEAAWTATPLAQISVGMGDMLIPAVPPTETDPGTPAVYFPTLTELMANPTFASAFNVIGYTLYNLLKQVPALKDAVIAMPDTISPVVVSTTPGANATDVAVGSTVTATFDAAVQPETITFTLASAGGGVAAAVTYSDLVATLTPSAPLAPGVQYTATVSGVKDVAGNTLAAPVTWQFTTAS